MFHSTSGKRGFDPYHSETFGFKIGRSDMKKILEREEELRMGMEYQEKISEKDDLEWIRSVTMELQIRVLNEFGFTERYLRSLNNARFSYKNDPEMNNITVYQRCDKSRRGDIRREGCCPNIEDLYRLNGSTTSLKEFLDEQLVSANQTLILAGSIT